MEDEALSTSSATTITFVHRRWHNSKKDYVDIRGNILPADTKPASYRVSLLTDGPDPSTPPRDGSSPFLELPVEVRLQIYGYLTRDVKEIRQTTDSQFACAVRHPKASTTYAYLYRSPGRLTRPNVITREVVRLFQVNQRTRQELLDHCFSTRTFVLEASLYSRDVGGLKVLPAWLGMTAWVKRLLLITTIDSVKSLPKGMADLRPLQQMTNLEHVHIMFRQLGPMDMLEVANNPVRAILDCVPPSATISLGADAPLQKELLRELGQGMAYLFQGATPEESYKQLCEGLPELMVTKGCLSGSRMNHGDCRYPICVEAHKGIKCANSQTPPPNALPALDLSSPSQQQEPIMYHCGCVIRIDDGGYLRHRCRGTWKDELGVVETLERQEQEDPQDQPRVQSGNRQAPAQRRKRRWFSWGGQ